ncbi:hypothetical protein SEMRO_1886_G303580.1 [Seminavis robusta]|uniref:Uncharacterized protein n=1 Tax=Seminavis robusta TaxID=568900 RepID=A0A9N8HTI3_9STRA|nr:hypothetical protein SEMRO_1886_G303580.1 [Seminavis robusta]|eukprot:Sro1886_g303580.1 n/a (195) ;mRNA; f:6196-6780
MDGDNEIEGGGYSQQDAHAAGLYIQQEVVDVSMMAGPPMPALTGRAEINERNAPAVSQQETQDETQDDDRVLTQEDGAQGANVKKKSTRKRRTFRLQWLVASSDMYLKDDAEIKASFDAAFPLGYSLDGQVVACPKADNDKQYTICWRTGDTGVSVNWVRSSFPKVQFQETIWQCIEAYQERKARDDAEDRLIA